MIPARVDEDETRYFILLRMTNATLGPRKCIRLVGC